MIRSFRHRGLKELFESGKSAKVKQDLQDRCRRRLDAIDNAISLDELRVPSYRLHLLKGDQKGRYAIDVNGPWRITFEWVDGDAYRLDLDQYH